MPKGSDFTTAVSLTDGYVLGYNPSGSRKFPTSLFGSFTVTSQATALAGTNNTEGMTPLRTRQAIDARAVTEMDVLADADEIVITTNLGDVAAILPLADTNNAGLLSPGDFDKLVQLGPLNTPGIANISADGNDTTGNGTMLQPYLTAQKAYDEGYQIIAAGAGNFGNIVGTTLDLTLIGIGKDKTIFGNITGTSGYVRGNGMGAVSCGHITIAEVAGAMGADSSGNDTGGLGGDGIMAAATMVEHLTAESITLRGGAGGAGGQGGPGNPGLQSGTGGQGGTGGDGATLNVRHCSVMGNVTSRGGYGGAGGSAGENSGAGIGDGGNGGQGGGSGSVNLFRCDLIGEPSAPVAVGGAGGSGASPGGAGSNGGIGSVITTFSVHTASSSGEGVVVMASVIGGVFDPS